MRGTGSFDDGIFALLNIFQQLCVPHKTDFPTDGNGFRELFVNPSNGASPIYGNLLTPAQCSAMPLKQRFRKRARIFIIVHGSGLQPRNSQLLELYLLFMNRCFCERVANPNDLLSAAVRIQSW